MGVGNTLTLLNGRRLVNSGTYQTELIGGDFVPTISANSNLIPVYGLERVEVLRDGASAIYGADAVAGVVNNVLQKDFEGLTVRAKITAYDHFETEDNTFNVKWGSFFNDGATNVSVFFDHYDRGAINAQEDPRWGAGEHRPFVDDDSPWKTSTAFRNTSTNSNYPQMDMVRKVLQVLLELNMTKFLQTQLVSLNYSLWEILDVLIEEILFLIQVMVLVLRLTVMELLDITSGEEQIEDQSL